MKTSNKHKYTILDDNYSPFVLAWIEKNGATSEEEILFDTKLERSIIKNVLVKLFDNEFITTYKNYFKISLQGKYILDKLEISKNLLSLTINDIEFDNLRSSVEIENEYLILENYRDNFYDNYLNTQRRLNLWNRIVSTKEFENKNNNYKVFCKRAIISNDILKTYNEISSEFKDKALIIFNNEKREFNVGSVTKKYLNVLNSIENIEKLSKAHMDVEDDVKFFIEFETLNNIIPSEKHSDDWYDLFNSYKTKDLNERTLKSYIKFRNDIFHQVKSGEPDRFKVNYYSYPTQKNSLKSIYDALFILESSNDIKELAESLSVNQNSVQSIIIQLKKATEKYCR